MNVCSLANKNVRPVIDMENGPWVAADVGLRCAGSLSRVEVPFDHFDQYLALGTGQVR